MHSAYPAQLLLPIADLAAWCIASRVVLHHDSGRVERGLSFPQGSKMLYWLDRVYLRDE